VISAAGVRFPWADAERFTDGTESSFQEKNMNG